MAAFSSDFWLSEGKQKIEIIFPDTINLKKKKPEEKWLLEDVIQIVYLNLKPQIICKFCDWSKHNLPGLTIT